MGQRNKMTQALTTNTLKTSCYPLNYLKTERSLKKRAKKTPAIAIHRGNFCKKKFDARYLDPRTSRWLGVDPAMYQGDYIPSAPINDEARKRNENLPGQGGIYNYVNMHVYHYAGNNPVKYTDPNGRVPTHYDRVDGSGGGRSVENVRVNIASLAKDHIGSVSWNYNEVKGNLGAGTNKCNLFVYDVAIAAGADLGLPNRGGIRQRVNNIQTPPTAEQWADKNFKIPGWRVLSPNETSMPGDVVAEKINYSDASGHVAIVSGNGKTIGTSSVGVEEIKETTWGFRDNQEGKVVFRRWEGLE